MIGDKLILQPYHLPPAQDIYAAIAEDIQAADKYLITIGGESGCGKSTLSIALKSVLEEAGLSTFTIHMDDYFHLPPTSNHNQRLEDINHVGPQEVDLALLQQQIDEIKAHKEEIIKPLIHYKENSKRREIFYPADFRVIIVEGTYVSQLSNINTKVFMTRDYHDTLEARLERARDPQEPFVEEVLAIEHQIISKHADIAHILVDKDYNVVVQG